MAYLNLFRELWRYAGKQRWQVVAFITLHILSHIHTFVMPLIFGQILNILQEQPPRLLAHIEFWLCVWLVSFLFSAATHRLGRTYEFKAGFSIHRRFLHEHYTIITELPMQWHTDHHSGDTINRLNKAAAALRDFTIEQYTYVRSYRPFISPLVIITIA